MPANSVVPPNAVPGQTIHMILEVTDDGTPALTRYQRVIVTVSARSTQSATGTVHADAVAHAGRGADVRRVRAGDGADLRGDERRRP